MKLSDAIQLALRNTQQEGLTDVFPRPPEVDLLNNDSFRAEVATQVQSSLSAYSLDSLAISPIAHVLIPKGGPFDFRRCALIQPIDTIKYLALVLTLADEIEARRPQVDTKTVLSYRFKPKNGGIFEDRYNHQLFHEESRRRARRPGANVVVSCDIANFYDRLNLHRLESTLLSLAADGARVRQLNELLLFWANRDSYGLPVGSNASRILAEAALIEVDNYLLSMGVVFCRFVDDYRFFCKDAHQAHQWLTRFIERLWLEGLAINKAKTRIEEAAMFQSGIQEMVEADSATLRSEHRLAAATAKPKRKGKGILNRLPAIAEYNYGIPTQFRPPGASEMKRLRNGKHPKRLLQELMDKSLPEARDITLLVKTLASTQHFDLFRELPAISESYPQLTPYIISAVERYAEQLTGSDKRTIAGSFACQLIPGNYLPEYLSTAIVRLLGTPGFEDKQTLLHYFRGLQRNAGAYIGRCLLDALQDKLTRGEVIEVRNYYPRADGWERRAIARIVDSHLHEDEKRPWIKNVRIQDAQDLFLMEILGQTQSVARNRRQKLQSQPTSTLKFDGLQKSRKGATIANGPLRSAAPTTRHSDQA